MTKLLTEEEIESELVGLKEPSSEIGKTAPPDSIKEEEVKPPIKDASTTIEDENSKTWKQKHAVIRGMQEVIVAENRALKEKSNVLGLESQNLKVKVDELTATMNDLKTKLAYAPQSKDVTDAIGRRKDVLYQGNDALADDEEKIIKSKAQEVIRPYTDKIELLESEIKQMKQQLNYSSSRQTMSEDQMFFDSLEKLIPDYRETNALSEWRTWLSQKADFTRRTRQELLSEAQDARDASSVAEIFHAFEKVRNPQGGKKTPPIEPRSGAVGRPDSGGNKKIYTYKDIEDFTDAVTKGKFRGRDEEKQKIENELALAEAEGRIQ